MFFLGDTFLACIINDIKKKKHNTPSLIFEQESFLLSNTLTHHREKSTCIATVSTNALSQHRNSCRHDFCC